MRNFFKNINYYFQKIANFGIDSNIPYLKARKYRLINVVVLGSIFFLVSFFFLNIFQEKITLAVIDIILIIVTPVLSLYLQHKKLYEFNLLYISSVFPIYTFLVCIFLYDTFRQTEHILIPMSILPLFLFDGWKKNIQFAFYIIAFFVLRYHSMIISEGYFKIDTIHLIYLICFFIVYVLVSYFNSDMIKFYKKIEESNKTKDKLFRIISHDLRSPFNSLLGTSDIQLKYIQNRDYERIETTSRAINLASKKIYDLTQSLLEWSLSQTEQLEVKKTKFSLNESIFKVIDLCLITSKNKDVEIVFEPQFDIEVNLDYTMFQIVLRNIIMNSVKFSFREQNIVVETSKGKDTIVIKVRDFGVGMDEEQLNNIFYPDKYKTTLGTEKEKGSGLGLFISKELVEKQGGTIKIHSKKGDGTLVIISFPTE